MDAYDSLTYESIAFPETHPNHLSVLGALLGLDTAHPASAQALELGCAGGGNLVPMAYQLPGARFLGIDLSAHQLEPGRALVRRLGLDNIELRQGDILELGDDLGKFDYIIAHGVYSWVPQPVRNHLLDLASRLLTSSGILYVSYNTLPGWRMRGMLRDILVYACREAESPEGRIAAAQAAIARLRDSLQGVESLSARYLLGEIEQLADVHPSYLLFEYLAETNQAFLFSEFCADAERAGLRYLCDTDLRTLFPASYGSAVEQALRPIEDGLELEQWLDFVTNRNFRQSLLCRADADLPEDIAIDLDRFARFAFSSDLRPTGNPDLRRRKVARFRSPAGAELRLEQPLSKAVLMELIAHCPDFLPLSEVMPSAVHRVEAAGGGPMAGLVDDCLEELFSLFAHGGMRARLDPLRTTPPELERPRASPLAQAQLEVGAAQLTTAHHGNLDLDAFAIRLIGYLDGSRTAQEATRALADDLDTGRLRPPDGILPKRWPRDKLMARVRGAVDELIALFARQGILAPSDVA